MQNNQQKFQDYILLEKNYAKLTARAYLQDIGFFQQYINTQFDQIPLEEVSYTLIRSWIVSLVDSGISNSSINRKTASLKAFYKFLLKTKQIEINPLSNHHRP